MNVLKRYVMLNTQMYALVIEIILLRIKILCQMGIA